MNNTPPSHINSPPHRHHPHYPCAHEHARDGQESGKRSASPVPVGSGYYSSPYSSTSSSPPPSNLSVPVQNNNFYNLQMYHDTGVQSNITNLANNNSTAPATAMSTVSLPQNPYQSVQEVPYHFTEYTATVSNSRFINSNNSTPTTSIPISPHPPNPQPQIIPSGPVLQPIYATFGPESIFVTCPYCQHTESTEIEQKIGSDALLWACIIPGFGFLRRSKWETRHRCKNCLNVIGIHYP